MKSSEVQDVSTDVEQVSPRINLSIDRDKAAALGLNATQIENTLSTRLRLDVGIDDLRHDQPVQSAARARAAISGAT